MNNLKPKKPPVPKLRNAERNGNIAPQFGESVKHQYLKSFKKTIMKDQVNNTAKGTAEFIDLKNVKNPIYQPLAGKSNRNIENQSLLSNDEKANIKTIDQAKTTKNDESKTAYTVTEEKPILNLEGTLKLVEELHRRMVQRGRLVHTIENLDKFEIEQKQEAEDVTSNYYQGCEIEITDDKRNKFSTKNPVIIKAVALFVRDLCINKLAEIEAEIIIPK